MLPSDHLSSFSHNSAWLTWRPPPFGFIDMLQIDQDVLAERSEKMQGGWERKERKMRQTAAEKWIQAEGIWMKEQRARRRMRSDLTGYSPFLSTFQKKEREFR